MRVALPQDIKEARRIMGQAEDILNQARQEAQGIRAAAEEEVKARLQESEIVKAAQSQAQEILATAQAQATAQKEQADRYCLEVLQKLEAQLNGFLASLRKGMEALDKES